MRIITRSFINDLFTANSLIFQNAFEGHAPSWPKVAMEAPSSTSENRYPWLKALKGMREWIGDRVIAQLEVDGYRIFNQKFENTIGISKDDLEDENEGVYKPAIQDLGQTAAELPDRLVWSLLKAGFTSLCYDGQYFFDNDHPVINADGTMGVANNTGGGTGEAWFLLSTSRPIKPLIFQNRRGARLTRMDADTDEAVFSRDEYRYGVDMRCAAGFGLWQMAYGSKQPLTAANYEAARANILGRTGDYGRPLGLKPDLLVVGPTNEGAGRAIVKAATGAAGATNVWVGSAELHVESLLA